MALKVERYEGRRGGGRRGREENCFAQEKEKSELQRLVSRLNEEYKKNHVRLPVDYLEIIYDLLENFEKDAASERESLLADAEIRLSKVEEQLMNIVADVQAETKNCIEFKNDSINAFQENERVFLDSLLEQNFSWWHGIVNDFAVVGNEAMVASFVKHLEEQGVLQRSRELENKLFYQVTESFSQKGFECKNVEEIKASCGIGEYITANRKSMFDILIREALNTISSFPSGYRKNFKQRCSDIYLTIVDLLVKKTEQYYAHYLKSGFMQVALNGFNKELQDCRLLLAEVRKARLQ